MSGTTRQRKVPGAQPANEQQLLPEVAPAPTPAPEQPAEVEAAEQPKSWKLTEYGWDWL